ncbi:hypothetical protein ACNY4R_002403 [Cronobacter sakazakii]
MDKSREQFLEWFSREHEEVENSNELAAKVMKMIAWSSWQASRAAVEIEIPEVLDYWLGREGFAESIRAAGLKVKGE